MTDADPHIRDGFILLECRQGNPAAFAELVNRWQTRLEAHACRIIGNREAARDVVQESWLAVIRQMPALRDVDAFPKWVFRIVTRKAVDWIRRQQRARAFAADCREQAAHPTGEASQSARDRLGEALEALDPRDRGLVALYYFEGFDIADIADQMGLPCGTVKSRLYHARQRIRSLMEEQPHG